MVLLREKAGTLSIEIVAIRGAVKIEIAPPKSIADAALIIFNKILEKNKLQRLDLISISFTITPDTAREIEIASHHNITNAQHAKWG